MSNGIKTVQTVNTSFDLETLNCTHHRMMKLVPHTAEPHVIRALYAPTPPQGSTPKPKSKTHKKKNKKRVNKPVNKKKSKKKVEVGAQLSFRHQPVNIRDLFQ